MKIDKRKFNGGHHTNGGAPKKEETTVLSFRVKKKVAKEKKIEINKLLNK